MQETTVFTYRVSLPPTEWAKASAARRSAGDLWTRLVKIHRFCRKRHWPWPTEAQLKAHFKGRWPLHSQTIQALIEKFFATMDGVRTKRQNGDKKARYPWRFRRYFNPIFKRQALKMQGSHLRLSLGRGREPIRVRLPDALPTGMRVQAELGYGEIFLTVTRILDDPQPPVSEKAGGLDIGVIHLGVVSDGQEALAVSGRGLRSIKQGRAKGLAHLQKKRRRTQSGSRRRKRLNRARHRISQKVERVTRNALHHAANQIVAFCLATGITMLYAGDLGTLNHQKRHRRSRRTNQEIGVLEFGRLEQYLEYKLRRYGIPLIKISEAYTSQTCPHCGHLNKVAGRTYHCRACDYQAHRDGVGAVNILNKGMHQGEIRPGTLLVPERITYRRPVPFKRALRRSPAEPRHVAGGISGSESGGSLRGVHTPRRSHNGSLRISAL
ncbi:RNA-guided endonuclease InsQ/TnpB family protein [Sulfobacillus thermosulfidooxidans]|uniref:RNA-guided endonuclease InsQ/TnpB family protein n=1 Tax=Sulfobacillus thermosulfidooxidans TaxID=28034 RepID=UPI0002E78304|nr:RNA-guided endonuclease TnpB family protein [Sulfobacillus thermosulfidooxidans]